VTGLEELPSILSVEETAAALRVSMRTVKTLIFSGKLKAFNPDTALCVLRTDLQEFLEANATRVESI